MSDLPPFSGDDPTCPKCGNVGAFTAWRPGFMVGDCHHPGIGVMQGVEHLDRECRRCDYAWPEAIVEPLADWERELLEERDDPFATGTRYRDRHGEVWTVGSNGLMHHHSYSQRDMDAVRSEYGPLTRIEESR